MSLTKEEKIFLVKLFVINIIVFSFYYFIYSNQSSRFTKKHVRFSDKINVKYYENYEPFVNVESFESIRIGNNSYKVHEDLSNPHIAPQTMDMLNNNAHT